MTKNEVVPFAEGFASRDTAQFLMCTALSFVRLLSSGAWKRSLRRKGETIVAYQLCVGNEDLKAPRLASFRVGHDGKPLGDPQPLKVEMESGIETK